MAVFSKRLDRAVANMVNDADKAFAAGDVDRGVKLIGRAADALVNRGQHDEAIDLCVARRDYARAAAIAENRKSYERAAKLWFRAGDFSHSARARFKNGEHGIAAELFEQSGELKMAAEIYSRLEDYVRAAVIYEKAGQKKRAADLLVRSLSTSTGRRVVGAEAVEVCRRAGVLYSEIGQVDLAVRVLKWGGQNVFAGKLLARAGRHDEAIQLLAGHGDILAAAQVARDSGNEQKAQELFAMRAENEGRLTEAAAHYEQAGAHAQAARLYEFAGEVRKAAESHERAGQHESAAQLFEKLGDVEEAARCLRAAGRESEAAALTEHADHQEDSIRAYAAAGDFLRAGAGLMALARKGDASCYAEAVSCFEKIAQEHSDYLSARTMLAEAMAEQGDNRGAMSVLQSLLGGVATSVEHVPALYQYGRLLELEGYLAGARNSYQSAVAFNPNYRDAKARMDLLGASEGPALVARAPTSSVVAPAASVSGVGIPTAPLSSLPGPALEPDQLTDAAPSPVTKKRASETLEVDDSPLEELEPISEDDQHVRSLTADLGMQPAVDVDFDLVLSEPEEEGPRPEALVGVVLRGRFRIEKTLGRGAQAQVYLARDQVLDRPVAIKALLDSATQDEAALERFLREARLAARVHHPGCIAIFDFGEERGLTFMAMEYFKGRTVRDRIKRDSFSPVKALTIARDITDALDAVHQAGIVHRDIKPTNIMIDKSDNIRLTDFGVARNVGEETDAGMMVGTMKYMSPEQARGKVVDGRSDVFSLGVVLYEMLVGKPPFGGNLDELIARVTRPPPDLPQDLAVPPVVRDIVKKCMQRKPSRRYQSTKPLLEHLEEAIALARESEFEDEPTGKVDAEPEPDAGADPTAEIYIETPNLGDDTDLVAPDDPLQDSLPLSDDDSEDATEDGLEPIPDEDPVLPDSNDLPAGP